MKNFPLMLLLSALLLSSLASAQPFQLPPALSSSPWPAQWIAVKNAPARDYGVYHFRKTIQLAAKPAQFLIHVSADNRYKLFVNGEMASLGPARSDVPHWAFETVDLAPYLQTGINQLAAVVWNFSPHHAVAQMTSRTGFILQGNTPAEYLVNTDSSWKSAQNMAYSPTLTPLAEYFVVGPGEAIDGARYPWGWETANFDDSQWLPSEPIGPGLPGGLFKPWYERAWGLTPRRIPQMELTPQRLGSVRNRVGALPPPDFLKQPVRFAIPPHTTASLVLDQGFETTAYPVLQLSGGKGATIRMAYAETLYEKGGYPGQKGHRDAVDNKDFVGYYDAFRPDGGLNRQFIPLWWRTYRYLQLEVETTDDTLVLHDLYGIFTAYPFLQQATFEIHASDSPDLTASVPAILETGWRTARICANETYMDCPYYEQLQYVGDTRIQALVSLFYSGDDRLMRDAILQIRHSHGLDGITMSRYPSELAQYIPTFSLWWIAMLHDYHRYRNDRAFLQDMLPTARAVLHFFESRRTADGSLSVLPYWNFTDWARADGWMDGQPPLTPMGESAILDMQLLLAYQHASELERALGLAELAAIYDQRIGELRRVVRQKYFDAEKKLFADTPEKRHFSQHANSLAVLAGVAGGMDASDLMARTLTDTSLTQATIYFRYYVHQAAAKAGLGADYLAWLGEWRRQLALGLTTWAEQPEPTRSDCHAWGSSPNIELFRILLGIDSDAAGFAKVRIQPALGPVTKVSGSIPHPAGALSVAYELMPSGLLQAEIVLPPGISGVFVWKGKSRTLKPGKQILTLK